MKHYSILVFLLVSLPLVSGFGSIPHHYQPSPGKYKLKPIDFLRESRFILTPLGLFKPIEEQHFPKFTLSFVEDGVVLLNNYLSKNNKGQQTSYSLNLRVMKEGPYFSITQHANTGTPTLKEPYAYLVIDDEVVTMAPFTRIERHQIGPRHKRARHFLLEDIILENKTVYSRVSFLYKTTDEAILRLVNGKQVTLHLQVSPSENRTFILSQKNMANLKLFYKTIFRSSPF